MSRSDWRDAEPGLSLLMCRASLQSVRLRCCPSRASTPSRETGKGSVRFFREGVFSPASAGSLARRIRGRIRVRAGTCLKRRAAVRVGWHGPADRDIILMLRVPNV